MIADPMDIAIDEQTARAALIEHMLDQARRTRLRYGFLIDDEAIIRILEDRAAVRYPTSLHFDAAPLQPHEFAFARPLGFHSADGYALCVHPVFAHQPENLPLVVAYHIPVINYGAAVDADAAEQYGATLLGLDQDQYYEALCQLADSIGAAPCQTRLS